jgi:hypothetical protein
VDQESVPGFDPPHLRGLEVRIGRATVATPPNAAGDPLKIFFGFQVVRVPGDSWRRCRGTKADTDSGLLIHRVIRPDLLVGQRLGAALARVAVA